LDDKRTDIEKCEYYRKNKQKLQRDTLFAMLNLLHAKTVTIPGADFYITPDDTHIRLSYPPSEDVIIEYMSRLEKLVDEVKGKSG
jgi:aspartate/methionine/tyrosine aminotransferase